MRPKDTDGITNTCSVDSYQTAPKKEQSDWVCINCSVLSVLILRILTLSELQIKGGIEDNSKIIFLISQ